MYIESLLLQGYTCILNLFVAKKDLIDRKPLGLYDLLSSIALNLNRKEKENTSNEWLSIRIDKKSHKITQ